MRGHGDTADLGEGDPRRVKRLIGDPGNRFGMGAPRDLRHHPAEAAVGLDLAGDDVREDGEPMPLTGKHRRGGFVAGAFKT